MLPGDSNDNPREVANYREIHGPRKDPYFSSHLNPNSVMFEIRPTVVPAYSRIRRIPMLAVSHNLNWEGAPRFEFELISRLKKAGWIDPTVLSPCDGPLRQEYEKAGVRIEVDRELSAFVTDADQYQASMSRLRERICAGALTWCMPIRCRHSGRLMQPSAARSSLGVEPARKRTMAQLLQPPLS